MAERDDRGRQPDEVLAGTSPGERLHQAPAGGPAAARAARLTRDSVCTSYG